jgi:integrase/recombinase XerD
VENKLFENLNITDTIPISTKKNLINKSLLSGVIAGGPKLLKVCILPIKKSQSYFSTERAFPFDKIIPFINSLTSYRDKALYMFCAASGCRIHEALQILIEDISIKDRSIRLVDPFSRITNKTYTILSAQEKTKLSWKGRQTDRTILIQPFGDLFFEYLEKYIKEEYIPHNKHDFLFQYIRGKNKGKPYFLSAPASRFESFQKALQQVGLSNSLSQGVHSLRHMYGTYLVNYFPKSDGTYGLPIAIVQKIMGHSTLNATQKYARYDKDLISIELEYANSLIYNNTEKLSLLELKGKALKSQLIQLGIDYDNL